MYKHHICVWVRMCRTRKCVDKVKKRDCVKIKTIYARRARTDSEGKEWVREWIWVGVEVWAEVLWRGSSYENKSIIFFSSVHNLTSQNVQPSKIFRPWRWYGFRPPGSDPVRLKIFFFQIDFKNCFQIFFQLLKH